MQIMYLVKRCRVNYFNIHSTICRILDRSLKLIDRRDTFIGLCHRQYSHSNVHTTVKIAVVNILFTLIDVK